MEIVKFILKHNLINLNMKKLIKISLIMILFIYRNIIFAQSTPNGTDVSTYVNNNSPMLTDNQVRSINRC